MAKSRGRKRKASGSDLEVLLDSVTLDQLRTVLALLSSGPVSGSKTREEAIQSILETGRSTAEIRTTVLEVEAKSPAPHCFVASLKGKLSAAIEKRLLESPLKGDGLSPVHSFKTGECFYLTYEWTIPVLNWVKSEDGQTKNLENTHLRQPIVARINPQTSLLLLSYPGFSQGTGTRPDDRITYESLVSSLLKALRDNFGIETTSLPVRQCINQLSEIKSDRLLILREHSLPNSGKLNVASTRKDWSIDEVLSRHIAPHLNGVSVQTLRDAIRKASREGAVESLLVSWTQEHVLTRLEFWEIGTELLFVWHGTSRSYAIVDKIFELLSSISEQLAVPSQAEVWTEIAKKEPGEVIVASEFYGRFKLDPAIVRSIILGAIKAGIVEPVYRLKAPAELLDEVGHEWTTKISTLGALFRTESGRIEVDGRSPENIQIAFRRVNHAGSVS